MSAFSQKLLSHCRNVAGFLFIDASQEHSKLFQSTIKMNLVIAPYVFLLSSRTPVRVFIFFVCRNDGHSTLFTSKVMQLG